MTALFICKLFIRAFCSQSDVGRMPCFIIIIKRFHTK